MCQLVTADIFELANQHANVAPIYTEDEVEKLDKEEAMSYTYKYYHIDYVFGASSSLDKDKWLAKVTSEADYWWILDARELRM